MFRYGKSIMASHDTIIIMDIHKDNSYMDIQNSIMDICNSIMDIHDYRVYPHLAFHITIITVIIIIIIVIIIIISIVSINETTSSSSSSSSSHYRFLTYCSRI